MVEPKPSQGFPPKPKARNAQKGLQTRPSGYNPQNGL